MSEVQTLADELAEIVAKLQYIAARLQKLARAERTAKPKD